MKDSVRVDVGVLDRDQDKLSQLNDPVSDTDWKNEGETVHSLIGTSTVFSLLRATLLVWLTMTTITALELAVNVSKADPVILTQFTVTDCGAVTDGSNCLRRGQAPRLCRFARQSRTVLALVPSSPSTSAAHSLRHRPWGGSVSVLVAVYVPSSDSVFVGITDSVVVPELSSFERNRLVGCATRTILPRESWKHCLSCSVRRHWKARCERRI